MAIRYSGDVEIRVSYDRGVYEGHVRAPGVRLIVHIRDEGDPRLAREPDSYDSAAKILIKLAELRTGLLPVETVRGGDILIRRVFQSACPVPANAGIPVRKR